MMLLDRDLASFEESLVGTEIARMISYASFGLAVYEYFITLDEEVKYFWSGSWTVSQILFLLNRYLPAVLMIFSIACFSIHNPSPDFCRSAVQTAFFLNLLVIGVIQAILVTRVWYLFQDNHIIRHGIILGFMASLLISFVFLYLSMNKLIIILVSDVKKFLPTLPTVGCRVACPLHFGRVYLPSLALHTILYILTAYRALRNRRLFKDAPVLKRLLRDGGLFYIMVFVTVIITTVGSFLKDSPKINNPSIFSHFMLATNSIAVSRVMFSIQSLASKIGSNSGWLLNNAELSRVGFKMGAHERVLIVERETVYSDVKGADDLESNDNHGSLEGSVNSLWMSRVGVLQERSW